MKISGKTLSELNNETLSDDINISEAKNLLSMILRKHLNQPLESRKLYKFISCPNYLGEILEWVGFAIISWSFPAFLFVVWTMANLIPRAKAQHIWYKEKFGSEYSNNKKAIFPFIY